MAKKKLKINDLKVQSIVTSLESGQMQQLKGGREIVGRLRNYSVRWTAIDTRAQAENLTGFSNGG